MDVLVPDLGDFKDIPVIEVLVKAGDEVQAEQSLVTLESDKATMEVPSPAAGVVRDVKLKPGDKVSKGTLVCTLEEKSAGSGSGDKAPDKAAAKEKAPAPAAAEKPAAREKAPAEEKPAAKGEAAAAEEKPAQPTPRKEHGGPTETVPPPPRGGAGSAGDGPEPKGGGIGGGAGSAGDGPEPKGGGIGGGAGSAGDGPEPKGGGIGGAKPIDEEGFLAAHAGPGVRKLARELGVDLGKVKGTGPKERVLPE